MKKTIAWGLIACTLLLLVSCGDKAKLKEGGNTMTTPETNITTFPSPEPERTPDMTLEPAPDPTPDEETGPTVFTNDNTAEELPNGGVD